jgi:ubiquinone/menaquinone biosynthesis C-methylase UbiE
VIKTAHEELEMGMNHDDHVHLIEPALERNSGGTWVDFGAGSGAFTLALRDLAGPDVELIAVDRDRDSLRSQRSAMERRFLGTRLQHLTADFRQPLSLPPLDGVLSANAVHYVADQVTLLTQWRSYLKPDGRLIIVEYDTDKGNRWVPYPLSFAAFQRLAPTAGFTAPTLLGVRPSRFLGRIYAAMAGVRVMGDG